MIALIRVRRNFVLAAQDLFGTALVLLGVVLIAAFAEKGSSCTLVSCHE